MPEKPVHRARPAYGRYILLAALALCLLVKAALLPSFPTWSPHKPSAPPKEAESPGPEAEPTPQMFQLKHVFHHGTGRHHRVHRRLDITPEYARAQGVQYASSMANVDMDNVYEDDWPQAKSGVNPWTQQLAVKERPSKAKVTRLAERHTPHFLDSYLDYAMRVKGNPAKLNQIHLEWEPETDVSVPDVHDKELLVSLALISSNAYVRFPKDDDEKKRLDWIDVGDPWAPDEDHNDINFGWLDVGLRGHVFVSNDLKTVIIGFKGTSGAGLPGGGSDETSASDKTNDNLLFSCCCARVGYLWTTVCDCYEKTYTCNQDCLEKELLRQDRYYQAALDLYRNVTKLYPPDKTDIWVTGHSLGGALASLLGRTYGLPVVAFEAPGEMLATKRLHLPQAPGVPRHLEHIWHIGNTADPIFMGVCNGALSSCSAAGYAMETACHMGQICVYDVVTDLGWHVNLLNHRIHTVIDDIILAYNETAPCMEQPPCRDCFNWRFTSHDDAVPDEPRLPHPLKPHPTTTKRTLLSSTSTATHTTLPSESEVPKKCLERTWYGWCSKWGYDDDE